MTQTPGSTGTPGIPRRAFVTGGSSGIGRCVAETLARAGCDVGIVYVGEPAAGESVMSQVEQSGQRGWSRIADVADSAQVNDAVESFTSEFGGIDILVTCAGIFRDAVTWKMTDAQWQDVIDVDLTGVFTCVRAAVPHMRAGGWGAIVNISSINGLRGKFGQVNYTAAKAGVNALTKTLARETARFNITVNAVAPGLIRTPILDDMPAGAVEESVAEILVGRVGEPEDVAEMVAFLCSDQARFITGEIIRVDGGQYI